jgi:hypothetical protein
MLFNEVFTVYNERDVRNPLKQNAPIIKAGGTDIYH